MHSFCGNAVGDHDETLKCLLLWKLKLTTASLNKSLTQLKNGPLGWGSFIVNFKTVLLTNTEPVSHVVIP